MFFGYELSRWAGVLEWTGIVSALALFAWIVSIQFNQWWIQEELKRDKLNKIREVHKNKQNKIYLDVA
jgi:hypothetical protein